MFVFPLWNSVRRRYLSDRAPCAESLLITFSGRCPVNPSYCWNRKHTLVFLHGCRGTQFPTLVLWSGWGLVWAQWAIWHAEEAVSLRPHGAAFFGCFMSSLTQSSHSWQYTVIVFLCTSVFYRHLSWLRGTASETIFRPSADNHELTVKKRTH